MRKLMHVVAPFLIIASFAVLLAGCAGTLPPPDVSDTKAICQALVKDYKYNTYKKDSARHAGDSLAVDLKQHNQIWRGLRCKVAP